MSAATIDAEVIETVPCKRGTVTLLRSATHWMISAVASDRTFRGKPAIYTFVVPICDCRTNDASPRRHRSAQAVCHHNNQSDAQGHDHCACHDNFGYRPLCDQSPRHNTKCHRTKDHCTARVHEGDAYPRRIFEDVVRSYSTPVRVNPVSALSSLAPGRRITAGGDERKQYAAWLAENDPVADSPHASAG